MHHSSLKAGSILLADRYGGDGLSHNGGSARCGFAGNVQVKGVGATPLVGDGTDYYHSYGGANIAEAVLEAIWSEICHGVLPHGTARAYSLVLTGTKVPLRYPRSFGPTHLPRALLLRQPTIRPAHYMRAVYFKPIEKNNALVSDTARTRAAVLALPAALRTLGLCATADAQATTLDGLSAVFRRAAEQLARARARRIMHGSLTSSNMGIDGKWLDLTTITSVSDYGRVIIPRGAPDFMAEDRMLVQSLLDFSFYPWKYLHELQRQIGSYGDLTDYLSRDFYKYFNERLHFEFLMLTGVGEAVLRTCPADLLDSLYSSMMVVMRSGNRTPFTILSQDNDYVPTMPTKMGNFHMGTILRLLAVSPDRQWAEMILERELSSPPLRADLIQAWFNLSTFLNASATASSKLWTLMNCIRLNTTQQHLFRTKLYPSIDTLALRAEPGSTEEFINSHIEYGLSLMRQVPMKSGTIALLSAPRGNALSYSITGGFEYQGVPVAVFEGLRRMLQIAEMSPDAMDAIRIRYETEFS